jgi:hypothetical protein
MLMAISLQSIFYAAGLTIVTVAFFVFTKNYRQGIRINLLVVTSLSA